MLTLIGALSANLMVAEPANASFAFNHLSKQLGAGGFAGTTTLGRFSGEYHDHDNVNYGGVSFDYLKKSLHGTSAPAFYYGLSVAENSVDYDWQLDAYFTASYEAQLTNSTVGSIGISASFNGLPYRMFFNDSGNRVATGYSIGPVIGIKHIAELSQGVTLAPFAHYFYSSQSLSSRSLWNIFADAFSGDLSERSEHDYRDIWVAGVTLDANQLLITPSYVRSNNAESWHLSVGVNF